jgi:hypothetical protein
MVYGLARPSDQDPDPEPETLIGLPQTRASMISARRQRQAAAPAIHPLKDVSILQHTFTFLPGHWLYLGPVCKEWEAVYADMGHQQVRKFNELLRQKPSICGAKTTLYSAAVASPATSIAVG